MNNINEKISEIAKETCILETTLLDLSEETKIDIINKYSETGDIKVVYELMEAEFAVSELKNVSELIKIPLSDLKKLPRELQEQLCGCWFMQNGMGISDEETFIDLKDMIKNYKKENYNE